jgi:hypothetical protein
MANSLQKAAPAKKLVETGSNSNRRNGKAWKKRVCGDRHSPDNCSKCVNIYSARWNIAVTKRREAAIRKALETAPEVGKTLTKTG